MSAYYNEHDSFAARWLRNLIAAGHLPAGDVDERSIVDVQPGDLRGYTQCHFFAGIGGWPYALRLAGWSDDRPVWTGSCPCQPLSSAGQQKGHADERHLWPAFYRLIAECRPATVFGEQVASSLGREWLAGIRADLEVLGYACGAADLCAASVGAPHIRQRLFWVADAQRGAAERHRHEMAGAPGSLQGEAREQRLWLDAGNGGAVGRLADHSLDGRRQGRENTGGCSEGTGAPEKRIRLAECGDAVRLADADGRDASAEGLQRSGQHGQQPQDGGTGWLGDADDTRSQGWGERPVERAAQFSPWASGVPLHCTDGKARRVEPILQPMVDGLPRSLGRVCSSQIAEIEAELAQHADATETSPREALHDLWNALVAEAIQRSAGGFNSLHEPAVLLAFLRQLADQGWPVAQGISRASSKAPSAGLRMLRIGKAVACPPSGRRLEKQPADEPPDSLRVLSSVLARHAQAAWGDAFSANAAAVHPLAKGVPGRVGRLRAYGNAIVGPLAAVFVKAAMEAMS